jgi:hypothetical protein
MGGAPQSGAAIPLRDCRRIGPDTVGWRAAAGAAPGAGALAVEPKLSRDGGGADALATQVKYHDDFPQSDHRRAPHTEKGHHRSSSPIAAHRPDAGMRQPNFSIGTFGEYSAGAHRGAALRVRRQSGAFEYNRVALSNITAIMRPISRLRFNALASYARDPRTVLTAEELGWFEHADERVLGVLIRDRTDDDYSGIVLARD